MSPTTLFLGLVEAQEDLFSLEGDIKWMVQLVGNKICEVSIRYHKTLIPRRDVLVDIVHAKICLFWVMQLYRLESRNAWLLEVSDLMCFV